MKQYYELKNQSLDALLLFRMGDFFELFGEDAVVASRILNITLTSRDRNKPNPIPMAGVPHHSVQGYIQKLLDAGMKVSLAEQVEDPSASKGIVKREIVKTFTPAVQFESASSNRFLGCVVDQTLACLEPSTGELRVGTVRNSEEVVSHCEALPILHLLAMEGKDRHSPGKVGQILSEKLPRNYVSLDRAKEILGQHAGIQSLAGFFEEDEAIIATAILIEYVRKSQKIDKLNHIHLPRPLNESRCLRYGTHSNDQLELDALFSLINRTKSAAGSRRLRNWISEPLKDPDQIQFRQDGVRELLKLSIADKLSKSMSEIYDLERILGRITARLANPKDILALGTSLAQVPKVCQVLRDCQSRRLEESRAQLELLAQSLSQMAGEIVRNVSENPPATSKEHGIFARGTNTDLDRLITLTEDANAWLIEYESEQRRETGISNLKVKYNRVFGYYIDVTKANLKSVPGTYQRKQSTVNSERFFTPELKKHEEEVLTANDRRKALEQKLFEDLVSRIRELSPAIRDTAACLAQLDAMMSLSKLGEQVGWNLPAIDSSLELEIEAGRHPVVDAESSGSFVPNNLKFDPEARNTILITGPNMGGKSTVMRQTAIIVILGQIGAPVPAARARWGVFHSIFTRIGANDAISKGQSTFMVEMMELSQIINHANERSLIVLDEIGRGTSTYDGMSVAWATLEWIAKKTKARTMFATHFHELTHLANELPGVANAQMAVDNSKPDLRFLYKLVDGAASESFGIQVAKMAGLPRPLTKRAQTILNELEQRQTSLDSAVGAHVDPAQLSLLAPIDFDTDPEVEAEPNPIIKKLEETKIEDLTPLQALNFLNDLKDDLQKEGPLES